MAYQQGGRYVEVATGEHGGRYTRDNIRPHCSPCSCRSGQRRTAEIARAKSLYGDDDRCRECRAHYLAPHADGCALRAQERASVAPGWD